MDRKRERSVEVASSRSPKYSRVDHTLDSVLALAGQHASARYAGSDPLTSPASPPVRLDPVFVDFPTLAFPYPPNNDHTHAVDPPLAQAGSFVAMLAPHGSGEAHAAAAAPDEPFPHPGFGSPGHGKGAAQGVNTWPSPAHHGISTSPSVNSISSFATTPSLAASTSSAMSHSSSADTLSTRPSSHFSPHSTAASPGVYCVVPPSPAPSGYFGEPSSHGLGLDFAAPSLASLPEEGHGADAKGKSRVPSAMIVDEAGGVSPEPRKRQTTRPVDVSRRGEDIGLSLGDFDILDTLGTGTFGRVLLVRLRTSPRRPTQTQPHYFAMKVLEKNTIVRLRQVEHVNSERTTLAHVDHPFVVNLFCTFQDEANLYMLLEFVQGGELFSHLRRAGRFSPDVSRFYIANLVLVLEHLHKQDIVYRDLKPENLLIGADGHIKVTDFGFAKYVQDRTFTLCGTPEYLAPEIITATGHNAAADWWALGVLLFELLAGYPPFFADNPLEIYEKILKGRFAVPRHVDPLAKDLIKRLLTADLSGAQDVKSHPWFEGVDWLAVERKEIRRKYGFVPEKGPDPYGYLFPNF
ncbi:Cytochrome c oxidase subunit 1 [Rhodotorula toruloides]